MAAAVAGEELPLPLGAAAALRMGSGAESSATTRGGDGGGGGGGSSPSREKVESLADILSRADDGPGNLREMFRLVGFCPAGRLLQACSLPCCVFLCVCVYVCARVRECFVYVVCLWRWW